MVQSNTAATTDRPASNSDAIQRTREYYFAILAGVERRSTGPFTKPELADLLGALRDERPVATSRAEDE